MAPAIISALLVLVACTAISSGTILQLNSTGVSCKTVFGDASWPVKSVWKKAMPEIEPYKARGTWKQPSYRLDATTVGEVVAAVNFTREHNIRLSILASGHDFIGRNDAPNGLSLVLTGLKGMRVLSNFTPTKEGAAPVNSKMKLFERSVQSEQAYVTFGAGYNTRELNSLLAPSKLFTLGAAHSSVTVAGGWGQTAGHAPFSSRYGLGVDQVVEYKVVTADGVLRVANEVSNPDLFWALRGGGGGTYGVVVEATIKAHASHNVSAVQFWLNTTDYSDRKSIYPAAAEFHNQFMQWTDKGLSAYYFLYPNAMSVFIMYSGPNASAQWMNTNLLPMMQKLATFPGMNRDTMLFVPMEYPDFLTFFKAIWGGMAEEKTVPAMVNGEKRLAGKGVSTGPSPASLYKRHGPGDSMVTEPRGILYLDSWLLGKKQINNPNFAATLEAAMPNLTNAILAGQFIGGGQVIAMGKNDTTAVLPAWRKTYVHLIIYADGKPNSLPLRKFAPDMGAYVNEAYPATALNWRSTFWGTNYPRLSALKKKYDPTSLFWVTPGINAETWLARPDGRLCRNTDLEAANSQYPPPSDNHNEGSPQLLDEIKGSAFPFIRRPDGSVALNTGSIVTQGFDVGSSKFLT